MIVEGLLAVIVLLLWRIDWNTRTLPFARPWWNRAWRRLRREDR